MTDEILYHPEVFMPEWFEMPTERVQLLYTKHALYACSNDRYGAIPVFKTIPLDKFELVELGVVNEKVSKIVVRGHFDSTRDIVFALIPGVAYKVKTCWYNLRTDKHKTLNTERYATA